jgi:hypothetical protein
LRTEIVISFVLIALGLIAIALVRRNEPVRSLIEADDQQGASAPRAAVLVELFTSEGCSSCPPADELLTHLEQTQPVAGAEVIALSEHVDYWNRLGWTDPYSSAQFSARQNDYARIFDTDEVYTPQMIVDGRAQFVGGNLNRAQQEIANAARDSKATVTVSLASENAASGSIALAVHVEGLLESRAGDKAEVLLALTEGGLRSNVSRGENAGRRLSHTAVVRKLSRLGDIDSHPGAAFSAQPVVRIDKTWRRDDLKAVVFVQERASRRVLGAAAVPLAK